MKKLSDVLVLVAVCVLTYAMVPKTTIVNLPADTTPYSLTYTGLGIYGSSFIGFIPSRIIASGAGGYDAGVSTLTITPAPDGWTLCERGERGQFRAYGFVTGSVPIKPRDIGAGPPA